MPYREQVIMMYHISSIKESPCQNLITNTMMYVMYSTRSISYVLATTSNNELNVMSVMYSTTNISYVIARAGNNELNVICVMYPISL
jgi:hypothetical protein